MLYLNEKDITGAAGYDEIMDVIEEAYKIEGSKDYYMPPRMYVNQGENTILYMPCFIEKAFGTKILTLFPGNAAQGKPVIEGVVLLNDLLTGTILAIFDGAKLTAMRTGAVGGVGIRHTAPKNAKNLGLIGAGVQGYHQVLFASQARPIKNILLYDSNGEKREKTLKMLEEVLPHLDARVAEGPEEILQFADIVITATPSETPVLPDDPQLLAGKSYIGIGSYKPQMREFPESLYSLVKNVFIDTVHGLEESGDLITPLKKDWISRDQIVPFNEYLESKRNNYPQNETTLFKSVGMALFDITVAELIYRKALEKGIGQNIIR
ncbi:MAG: ornithine cyclodeaminase family protein [Bacillota bacterium]|nr:ornithine cyclodeaminase family protein [Bacillota bacterium]